MNLDDYINAHTTEEDDVLKDLRRKTNLHTTMPRQLSGQMQGKMLEMFSMMIKPKSILEIGTFTGYSAYCLQKGLQNGGKMITIEIKDELEEHIQQFFNRANIANKVKLVIADAAEYLKTDNNIYDLIFIDGDKRQYPQYYTLAIEKLKSGGYMLIDNVLWSGKVLEKQPDNDHYTRGVMELNDVVQSDSRVENVLIPIRDGLTLIRKK